jgi:hypothetical protein
LFIKKLSQETWLVDEDDISKDEGAMNDGFHLVLNSNVYGTQQCASVYKYLHQKLA